MSHLETPFITTAIAGQQDGDGGPFPLVVACDRGLKSVADVVGWLHEHRDAVDAAASRHGAILFRDFPLQTDADFDAFVCGFDYPNFPYEQSLSNAVRVNRTQRVFTANEAPADVTIYLHHEMAQTPIYPSRLFFFCEQPAEQGGQTPLCRSDWLLARLTEQCPRFVHDCEARGLRYTNVMPSANDPGSGMGRSWQSTFGVATRAEAEQRMAQLGYEFEWLDDGCLRATTPRLPAIRRLPDGRRSFFNQLIAAHQGWKDTRNDPSKSITHGDGTPLDASAVAAAVEIAEQLSFDVSWQRGDVALLDNYLVMHGRRRFQGRRGILASLVAGEGGPF